MTQLTEIIKGCISGKNEFQEKLYKLYSRKLFGVCLHYSKDYTEAEDILQEGFIKIFTNISKYKHKGSFEGWMRKIMVNTALENYRKQKLLYPVSDVYEYADKIDYDDIINNITAKDLLKLIQELSPKYRTVFSLYAIDGYSHKEISKMTGTSIGTSKSNLSRARVILQQKVEKYFKPASKKIQMIQ